MSKTEFTGSGMIIWFSDGKQKYKMFDDQDSMEKEYDRLIALIPPYRIIMLAINWDNQELLFYKSKMPQELPS